MRVSVYLAALLALVVAFGIAAVPHASDAATVAASRVNATRNGRLGNVHAIKKGLTVLPPHSQPGKGKLKQPVYGQYLLRTASGQKASVAFVDGSLLHMNQRTDIVFRSPSETDVRKGEVDEIVVPGTAHSIHAAGAITSAIGTNFDVQVVNKRTSVITVVEGAVQVKSGGVTVVVESGQQTKVRKGKAPSHPKAVDASAKTAWTGQLPGPDQPIPENLGLGGNGGRVVDFSSQSPSSAGTWNAANVIDGRLDRGWASAPPSGVKDAQSQQTTGNQFVSVGLGQDDSYAVSEVIIDPAATGGLPPTTDLKSFQLWASTSGFSAADFHEVASGTTQQSNSPQTFKLPAPVSASYLKLVATGNYGGSVISVAEMEIVGQSQPVATPTPTSSPALTATSIPNATPTPGMLPTATPKPVATAVPAVILGGLSAYSAADATGFNSSTCSAPGGAPIGSVASSAPDLYIKQSTSQWKGTHTWRADWTAPDGNEVYTTGEQSETDDSGAQCAYIALDGEPTFSMPGTWTVRSYVDGALSGSTTYTMIDDRTTPAGAITVSDSSVWREPSTTPQYNDGTCDFPGEVQSAAILTTDKAELTKYTFSQWSGTHNVYSEYFGPNGLLFGWYQFTRTDQGAGNYCTWIWFAGQVAASMPGEWLFKLTVDRTPTFSAAFTLSVPAGSVSRAAFDGRQPGSIARSGISGGAGGPFIPRLRRSTRASAE